ncbi:serine hydrolase [Suttonella ornithocola]|uniref:serine hydrolase n=1 Tax=Suttonella ornithocola TaxID=279832 RepID=UPI001FE8DB2E|nr:serine hydrolase [Suttonella ornithocola]
MPNPSYANNLSLNKQVQNAIQKMRLDDRIANDEKTVWLATDIHTGRAFLEINPNQPMQMASMVKPLVIQAYLYCHYLKNPQLYPLNDRIMEEMRAMIVKSNNTFTNYLFKRLGGPQGVQWMLRKQAPNIFRNIHIVENIPSGGKTYLNKATAADYTRFMHALWRNQLPGAEILKNLMSIKNHNRITVNTQHIPNTLTVYDKTGSTSRLCGNFGIIDYHDSRGNSRPYTFTGIIEKKHSAKNYASWITSRSNVMREISDIVYLFISQQS